MATRTDHTPAAALIGAACALGLTMGAAAAQAPADGVQTPPFLDPAPGGDAPQAPLPDQAPDEQAVRAEAANAETAAEDPRTLSREERLTRAFAALLSAEAEDEETWRQAEREIAQLWSKSGSASADLLLRRGREALQRDDTAQAAQHFDDVVNLAPDFAEGWNMRATLYFQQEALGESLADIAEVLAREPRHFGALSGLGTILESIDQDKNAIAAFREALKHHPNLEGALEAVKRLAPSTDGRGI